MDLRQAISEAIEENASGIDMRGGKKYTTVAKRVGIFRAAAGTDLGCETEIVHYGRADGEPVVMRAIIRDTSGAVIATGHAEEIRGVGNVNTNSALENAETSAIGRALANLGLSGGEFASVNELDAAERKTEAKIKAREKFEREVSNKINVFNEERDLEILKATWSELYKTQRDVADDPRVIAAKDKAKARIEKRMQQEAA